MVDLTPEALRNHSKLFALLDDAGQRRLVAVAVEETFATGYAVVNEGEGRARQVDELPVDAELVILRRPIAGG